MAFFSILAVGLIWRTLTQTNKTNIAAVKAADAALEANKIMREELRPWLTIDVTKAQFDAFSKMYRSTAFSQKISVVAQNTGNSPARDAICTFASFSNDTLSVLEVSHLIEKVFFESNSYFHLPVSSVYPDRLGKLRVVPLPPDSRFFGNGNEWTLVVAAFYFWDGEVKVNWSSIDTPSPPNNVLKKQKYLNHSPAPAGLGAFDT